HVTRQGAVGDYSALAAHVDAGPVKRLLQAQAAVDHEGRHLQHRADDLAPARRTEREAAAVSGFAYHGTIVPETALARRERVRLARLGIEPHDAVVEEYPGQRRDYARAEYREQSLCHRAQVAGAIHDAEVGRAAVAVAHRLEAGSPCGIERACIVHVARFGDLGKRPKSKGERRTAGHARGGEYPAAAVGNLERVDHLRAIGAEILERQTTAFFAHVFDERFCDSTCIEI